MAKRKFFDKRILSKGSFFFVSLAVLVVAFCLCWLAALIIFGINRPPVLGQHRFSYVLAEAFILFSQWGAIAFFTFLVFYFSIYFSYLRPSEKSRIGRVPILVSLLFAAILFQVREGALPYFEYQKVSHEYQFQYSLLFFNKCINAYEESQVKAENKLDNNFELLESFHNIKRYQLFDRMQWLDEQTLLYNRGSVEGRAGVSSDRNPDNLLTVMEIDRLIRGEMDARRKGVFRGKSSLDSEKLTPSVKYNEIERANQLLESGSKQNQLEKIVTAYMLFSQYGALDEKDLEFKKGQKAALLEIERLGFFREDILPLFEVPVAENLLITQIYEGDLYGFDSVVEEIQVDAMVISQGLVTFSGIDIKGLDKNTGKRLYQIKSDFGQIRGRRLVFASLSDRISSSEVFSGWLYSGGDGDQRQIQSIPFNVSPRLLPWLDRSGEWKSKLGLYHVYTLLHYFEKNDPRRCYLFIELIRRIVDFGILLMFPLFLMIIGSRLRPKEKKRPWWLITLFPFVGGATYVVYQFFLYYMTLFISLMVMVFEIQTAFIVVFSILILMIIIGLAIFLNRIKKQTL